MSKRLSLLLAAIAVLTFALPAVASGAAVTNSKEKGGGLVPVGTSMVGRSTNFQIQTALGIVKCEKFEIKTELAVNSGSSWEMKGGEGTTSGCSVGAKSVTVTNIKVVKVGLGFTGYSITITFQVHMPSGILCHFEGDPTGVISAGGSHLTLGAGADMTGTPAALCEPAKPVLTLGFSLSVGSTIIFD